MRDETQRGLVQRWGQGHLWEEGRLSDLRADQAAVFPACGGYGAAQPPETQALGPRCVPLREVRGHSGSKPPGHLDPRHCLAHCSLGIQGKQKSARDSVYFQMTFLKKNSLPRCLTLIWNAELETAVPSPQTPLSSLVVGRGPGRPWGTLALCGQGARPGSGLCSWLRCVPSGTLTPPCNQAQQGWLVLASWTGHPGLGVLGHLLPCASHTAAPCFHAHCAPVLCPRWPAACRGLL